jgi:hypothetical protein
VPEDKAQDMRDENNTMTGSPSFAAASDTGVGVDTAISIGLGIGDDVYQVQQHLVSMHSPLIQLWIMNNPIHYIVIKEEDLPHLKNTEITHQFNVHQECPLIKVHCLIIRKDDKGKEEAKQSKRREEEKEDKQWSDEKESEAKDEGRYKNRGQDIGGVVNQEDDYDWIKEKEMIEACCRSHPWSALHPQSLPSCETKNECELFNPYSSTSDNTNDVSIRVGIRTEREIELSASYEVHLIFNFHHSVFDGISKMVLIDELCALYASVEYCASIDSYSISRTKYASLRGLPLITHPSTSMSGSTCTFTRTLSYLYYTKYEFEVLFHSEKYKHSIQYWKSQCKPIREQGGLRMLGTVQPLDNISSESELRRKIRNTHRYRKGYSQNTSKSTNNSRPSLSSSSSTFPSPASSFYRFPCESNLLPSEYSNDYRLLLSKFLTSSIDLFARKHQVSIFSVLTSL